MKRFLLPLAASVLIGALIPIAVAQPAQRQQNQQDRMQQMASTLVQNAVEAMAAQSDPLQLIYRKDVQRDLKLELAVRNRFANLHDKQQNELNLARRQNRRNPANLVEAEEKQRQETQAKIDELLTESQKKRLSEIALQLQGESSVLQSGVQKAIEASPDQVQQFQEKLAERDAKIARLQLELQTRATQPNQVQIRVQEIQKELHEALAGLLTEQQNAKLKELFGAPFKADA
jgi:hypothetical protein